MGSAKEYYFDDLGIDQHWVSKTFFTCPECGTDVHQEVEVPEPDYTAEKSRDMVTGGQVEIQCDGCGSVFEGDAWAGPAHCDIELIKYPETHISCDPPGYDRPPEDWYDESEVPDDPFSIFKSNHDELLLLIDTQAKGDGSSLLNRMIFAQILTFLEAYFCDTLITGLREHPMRLAQFAAKDGSIKQTEIKASDVLSDPDHVRKLIEHNLKSRLYHQFGSGKTDKNGKSMPEGVALWYSIAFGFALAPKDDDLEALRRYAALRHDCVHRNGVTKSDEKLTLFDKNFLQEALATANRIVNHVDDKIIKLKDRTNESIL
ncbi:hypothetical protein O2N63_13095 [Aliiroseovarius sp. KMU-50]|uniref:Apea-like HEPN domain-containing protein n=1 Tax=Aliiroseovarius salicola TaxID=3009082 RepID=A0ABT4W4V2_9RHOB|nr:hypothetical protein [Aliiroseovarius sp. KMU-50]MDA5095020.1 hypothetical protein [Aliiroseovarius sp. KMU-50]